MKNNKNSLSRNEILEELELFYEAAGFDCGIMNEYVNMSNEDLFRAYKEILEQ